MIFLKTLITIRIIGNLNSWQSLLPGMTMDSIGNSCDVWYVWDSLIRVTYFVFTISLWECKSGRKWIGAHAHRNCKAVWRPAHAKIILRCQNKYKCNFSCELLIHRSDTVRTEGSISEPFKNYLADFFRLGGGYPPFPVSFFGHNDFPLRGGEYPPIPLRKKPFFFPTDFPLRGWGGGYPLNGRIPLKRFWQVP